VSGRAGRVGSGGGSGRVAQSTSGTRRIGRTLCFRSVGVDPSPLGSQGARLSGCSKPVLGIAAPVLTLAGVDGTPCTTSTGVQLNCVSVPGQVKSAFVVFLVVGLVLALFSVVCQVKIITKAGYSGWYVLTQFVPVLGFVMFLMFTFGKWPIQERLEAAERGVGRGYPPPPHAGPGSRGGPGPTPMPGGGPGPSPYPGSAPPVGIPSGSLVQQPSSGPGPAPRASAVAVSPPPAGESAAIFCSWCGKERLVNAQAIHHCGSMERPAVYCMQCGTPLEGAQACASCGTPSTKVSR
jgi:hypothetical protein